MDKITDKPLHAQMTVTIDPDGKVHGNIALYEFIRDIGWLFFEEGVLKRATTKEASEVWNKYKKQILSFAGEE